MRELTVDAKDENLLGVIDFVNEIIDEAGCSERNRIRIDVAVEEIFVNIAHYAYPEGPGKAEIRVDVTGEPKSAVITFIDSGMRYNPLLKPDPNVKVPLSERQIGGLGIFMVKKSMDDMIYEYSEGRNILTIKKALV